MSKPNPTPPDYLAAAKEARSHGAHPDMTAALALIDIAESLRVLRIVVAKWSDYQMNGGSA